LGLANDHSAEEMAIRGYNASIRLAVEVGDNGTKELLEMILKEEEGQADFVGLNCPLADEGWRS